MDIRCAVDDKEGLYHRVKPDWFVTSSCYTEELNFIVRSRISKLYNFMERDAVPTDIQLILHELYGGLHHANMSV